jgi:hypothetical protein
VVIERPAPPPGPLLAEEGSLVAQGSSSNPAAFPDGTGGSCCPHFTPADASQLFLKAVVRKFCVRRIANMLRRHFYSVSEMYRYYAPETTKSSQAT